MKDTSASIALGFAQEIPGGFVFEIGNDWIQRRIYSIGGRVATTSLVNVINGEEYLESIDSEFEIALAGEGQTAVLDFKDFQLQGYETPEWNNNIRTLKLNLMADVNDCTLAISLYYSARAGDDFIRKWLVIYPCDLVGWTIREVTLEKIKLKELVEGVIPLPRYPHRFDNSEDRVHSEPDKVNVSEPQRRFIFGDSARAVVTYWGYNEGLFFFSESILGLESFSKSRGLIIGQREYTPLTDGLTTGAAVTGAYRGAPEVGLKRYNEYLTRHWCVADDKSVPVIWNTWLATLGGDKPVLADYSRDLLLEQISQLQAAGFYDALHLDLGWEAGIPLQENAAKFPHGIREIARRANEAGLDMSYWVNPFSSSYWKSRIEEEHPEWLVPGATSGRSGASAICPLTEYADYVERRFVELASEYGARVLYWDGSDWNVRKCSSRGHDHANETELEVASAKRLAAICNAAHAAKKDLIIAAFSIPLDNHRLCAVDMEQISDTHEFPTIQSELIQRQQMYQMTFEHPFRALWGGWYGVNWHEAGRDNLHVRSLKELIHAEMSMIGCGLAQGGASIDLQSAPPEFVAFLKKLFVFRKRFEAYFRNYSHVLGFPDGKSPDGSAHFIDQSGFIVLVNPTQEVQSVTIPLAEPELELARDKKHDLSDWTNLESCVPLDSAKVDKAPELELVPLEVRYIGVNITE